MIPDVIALELNFALLICNDFNLDAEELLSSCSSPDASCFTKDPFLDPRLSPSLPKQSYEITVRSHDHVPGVTFIAFIFVTTCFR